MNIYDFFNSPDVAEYCQSIDKTFDALESAVMINQCRTRTLAEKHAAYRVILAEYADMESQGIVRRSVCSVHMALKTLLIYEERVLEKYVIPENGAIYQARIGSCYPFERGLFTSYEKSFSDALESLDNHIGARLPITIRKYYADSEKHMDAKVSLSGEIINIVDYGVLPDEDFEKELEHSIYDSYFCLESYIDVPVPFKRGDIVELNDCESDWKGNVFVLQSLCRDDPKRHSRNLINGGDISDMNATFFFEIDGIVYCDWLFFYPDLRYCRRELEGEKRILKYLSHFLKNEICACTLLKLQKYFFADEILRELKDDHDLCSDLDKLKDKLLRGNLSNNNPQRPRRDFAPE